MSEVLQEVKKLHERLDDIEEDMQKLKGGNQPDDKIYVSAGDNHGQTPVIRTLLQEAKKGGKYDGLDAGEVEALLQKEGYDRSRQSVLNLMRRMDQEYRPAKFKSGSSNKASRILWIP